MKGVEEFQACCFLRGAYRGVLIGFRGLGFGVEDAVRFSHGFSHNQDLQELWICNLDTRPQTLSSAYGLVRARLGLQV